MYLFDKIIKKFLNNMYHPKAEIPTVNKEKVYLSIPYLGSVSRNMENTLLKCFQKYYP